MSSQGPVEHSQIRSRIAIGKDLLALLRDFVLVAIFLLLLAMPAFVGERLSSAGFEEGSFMGFSWKSRAQNYGAEAIKLKQALESANQRVLAQAAQLRRNEAELASLRAGASSPEQKRRIDDLVARNRALAERSVAASVKVAEQLRTSQPIVSEARETVGAKPEWAVVMGADRTLEEAQVESRRAILRGMSGVGLYQRQGSFRTVALAPSRHAAEAMLPQARVRSRDAYVVAFDKWCPRREVRENYTICIDG